MRRLRLLLMCLLSQSACQLSIPAMVFVGGEETGHVDGLLTQARFSGIIDMALDSQGNLLVIDGGNIRKITPTGEVSSIGSTRQWLEDAGIKHPQDRIAGFANIAVDSKDNIFITHTTCIRKLEKQEQEYLASTFVGTCYDQRSNTEAGIENPFEYANYDAELTAAPQNGFSSSGLSFDAQDNLYVTNPVLLRISPDKQVKVLMNHKGKPLADLLEDIQVGPDNLLYAQLSSSDNRSYRLFSLDEPAQIFKKHIPFAEHLQDPFSSFTISSQGYFYLLGGGPGYMPIPGEKHNEYLLQRVSPDGTQIQTWALPFDISFANPVLDEKRRVIYTSSRNRIYKIPLPDGA